MNRILFLLLCAALCWPCFAEELAPLTTIDATDEYVEVSVWNNVPLVGFQIVTYDACALTPRVTLDGSTWVTWSVIDSAGAAVSSITATGVYTFPNAGVKKVRLYAAGACTSAVVTAWRGFISPLPMGSLAISSFPDNEPFNIAQVAGSSTGLANTGAVGAGTQRVTLATDVALPAGTNAIGKLAANSGVDIGDVDILSIAAGDNDIGNVDLEFSGTAASTGTGDTGAQTLRVNVASSATLYPGTNTTSTTPEALAGSQAVREVLIMNDPDNTVDILVGDVTAQTIQLVPGQAIAIPTTNLANVYIVSVSGTPTVSYLGRN